MAYYTDKVYSSYFLDQAKSLEDMLVTNTETEEERHKLPQSRHAIMEARMKAISGEPRIPSINIGRRSSIDLDVLAKKPCTLDEIQTGSLWREKDYSRMMNSLGGSTELRNSHRLKE